MNRNIQSDIRINKLLCELTSIYQESNELMQDVIVQQLKTINDWLDEECGEEKDEEKVQNRESNCE